MEEMTVESDEILESQGHEMSRRQLAWGISLLVVAVIFGMGAGWLWVWLEQLWPSRMVVFFILSGWPLVFCGLLISGLSAATGLLCLIPTMISRVRKRGPRVLVRILTHLCVTAASLVWLCFWLLSGLNAFMSDYHKVTADTGESVVVSKPGFDPASFFVYTPKSAFVYEEIPGINGQAGSGYFDPDHCALERQGADLMLTCGVDVTRFPNPDN